MVTIPMKLHHLAAKSFCIRLVYEWATSGMPVMETCKNEDDYGTCPNHDRFIWQMYEMQVPSSIVIPNLIRDQVDYNMWSIVDHVKDWIRYHHSKHFFHDDPTSPLSEYIVKLIWKPDRTIDYVATAKNILVSGRLNAMEKFRFACTYCFVEEIGNLRKMANIAKHWDFETEPLLVYWSKYLKNELRTISSADNGSIEVIWMEKALKEYDLWPPIEYFFNRLNTTMKFRKFGDIVDHCGKNHLAELLAKIDDDEWNPMCRNSVAKILLNCAESGNFTQMRCIWRRFKNDINPKTFISVVEELVPLSLKNSRNFNALTPLLMEIWSGVPNGIQQSALRSDLLRRIGEKCSGLVDDDEVKFDFKSRRECNKPLEFFRILLSSSEDKKQRKKFLRDNFYWLVIWQPLASVIELLKEFCNNYAFLARLKKETKDSPEFCQTCAKLLRFGELDELKDVVLFCLSDEPSDLGIVAEIDAIIQKRIAAAFGRGNVTFSEDDIARHPEYIALRKDLIAVHRQCMVLFEGRTALHIMKTLKSIPGLKAFGAYLCSYDWDNLYDFLRNLRFFKSDSTTLDSFVIALMLLESIAVGTNYLQKKLCRGGIRDFRDFMSVLRPSREFALPLLKAKCKHLLFQCLFEDSEELIFIQTDVQDFMLWCCDGDEELADITFKKPQLFPKAFLGQLKSCFDGFTFKASDSMEEFLHWCFPSQQKGRQFKRDMIRRYREYAAIEDLLKQRRFRRRALNWFFDNDAESIEKFKVNELQMRRNGQIDPHSSTIAN